MIPGSRIETRPAEVADIDALVALLQGYMRETYGGEWGGSAEALRRDAFGRGCAVVVAEAEGRVVGFVAWAPSYDLHWCIRGGDVLDLFVARAARGRGIALALLSAAASAAQAMGGRYLRGGAVAAGSGGRLYARFAVCEPGVGCTVGGRAFRTLAEMAGRSAREMLRSLPERAWNYEA